MTWPTVDYWRLPRFGGRATGPAWSGSACWYLWWFRRCRRRVTVPAVTASSRRHISTDPHLGISRRSRTKILRTSSECNFPFRMLLAWLITEWSNWTLLRKLNILYFICCLRVNFLFLVWHLSGSGSGLNRFIFSLVYGTVHILYKGLNHTQPVDIKIVFLSTWLTINTLQVPHQWVVRFSTPWLRAESACWGFRFFVRGENIILSIIFLRVYAFLKRIWSTPTSKIITTGCYKEWVFRLLARSLKKLRLTSV